MKFFNKDFLSKCDQIYSFLRIWSHLLKKYLKENFNFCAVPQSFGIISGKHALYLKLHETWDFTLLGFITIFPSLQFFWKVGAFK